MGFRKREYSYNTIEQVQGYAWIDGKAIFRKVVELGALANAGSTNDAHGIVNLDKLVRCTLMIDNETNQIMVNGYWTNDTLAVSALVNDTNIVITTTGDMSAYMGYAILEYTRS